MSIALFAVPAAASAGDAKLGGSLSSMERQHEVAVAEEFSFLETPAEVRELVERGGLVRVGEGADYELAAVSFPFARTEVLMFIERLAAQYRAAVGEKLVVTSLTRPVALQPANAHELSVHPAGMAVDFRIPARARARKWLESALLELEGAGVLDVTREKLPPHYHVAVYPAAYRAHVERLENPVTAALPAASTSAPAAAAVAPAVAPAAAPAPSAPTGGSEAPLFALLGSVALGGLVFAVRQRSEPRSVRIPRNPIAR